MLCLQTISLLLLLSLGQVSCQSDTAKQARKIPQWGTGLIAVTVFLFLILVFYVTNIFLKKKSKSSTESDPTEGPKGFGDASVPNGTFGHYTSRSKEHEHVYDNPIEVHDNELTTPM
ncbi:PDZK1-interacting protein 1 [Dendropsophus ebraccatus]|uniref:PDZK1-interacting protein 1 n=1 Tax=Dendropsophus ebraccatus TaxID=150705 RepID=UPI003831AD49